MKQSRTFINNILTLLLLLIVGGSVVWFFTTRSRPDDQPVAQQAETPAPDQRATSTPTTEQKPTPTPTPPASEVPPDDQPEPTWTPAIVLPDATSPPTPTFIPTPTATPINPKEELIIELKSTTGQLAISPNGQEIAFSQLNKEETDIELWKLNLVNKRLDMLSTSGGRPQWSPSGETILFERRYRENNSLEVQVEIKIVDRNGQNEKVLMKRVFTDVPDYGWATAKTINVVSRDGVDELDLLGQTLKQRSFLQPLREANISLPASARVMGDVIITNEGTQLRIIQPDGESIIESPTKERFLSDGSGESVKPSLQQLSIDDFSISPNNTRVAYTIVDGPIEALWIADLARNEQRKLFELSNGGSIVNPSWSPDGRFIVIGHRPTGTYDGPSYELTMIQAEKGEIINLQVDKASNFVWGRNGKNL